MTVKVFRTARQMYAYVRHAEPRHGLRLGSDYVGLARPWRRQRIFNNGRFRWLADHGEMLLVLPRLSGLVLVHESAHLALAYARRDGLRPLDAPPRDLADDDEEIFCRALSNLFGSVVVGLYKRGLLRKVYQRG